jgi:hypothetical protein
VDSEGIDLTPDLVAPARGFRSLRKVDELALDPQSSAYQIRKVSAVNSALSPEHGLITDDEKEGMAA